MIQDMERKKSNGMAMCKEITIAKITIQNLAEFCVNKKPY